MFSVSISTPPAVFYGLDASLHKDSGYFITSVDKDDTNSLKHTALENWFLKLAMPTPLPFKLLVQSLYTATHTWRFSPITER